MEVAPRWCFLLPGRSYAGTDRCFCGKNGGGRITGLRVHCSSSIQGSRNRAWTDDSLARELRNFMAATGLPSDKIPTTKELAGNGRPDLANVVRRRGYKAIARLLATMSEATTSEEAAAAKVSETPSNNNQVVMNGSARGESDFSGSSTQSSVHQLGYLDLIRQDGTSSISETDSASSSDQSLEEKAKSFIRTGEFDTEQEKGDKTGVDDQAIETSGEESDSVDDSELESGTPESIALRKAEVLKSKLLDSRESTSSKKEQTTSQLAATKEFVQKDTKAQEPDDSRGAPHARAKDVTLLARELEEAKVQLALVQAKATAELAQAKQAAMERDLRLSTAEHALANLKQVKIEWWGKASKVELAGSFNGWQHIFVLQPDLSSEIVLPDGTRGPLMWETELWLYPGVYEIKFLVDGEWQLDHRREVVMKDMLQNNILRVNG